MYVPLCHQLIEEVISLHKENFIYAKYTLTMISHTNIMTINAASKLAVITGIQIMISTSGDDKASYPADALCYCFS